MDVAPANLRSDPGYTPAVRPRSAANSWHPSSRTSPRNPRHRALAKGAGGPGRSVLPGPTNTSSRSESLVRAFLPVVPGTTRKGPDEPATALQPVRVAPATSYSPPAPPRWPFEHPADQAGHRVTTPGSHRGSPVSTDLRPNPHVASRGTPPLSTITACAPLPRDHTFRSRERFRQADREAPAYRPVTVVNAVRHRLGWDSLASPRGPLMVELFAVRFCRRIPDLVSRPAGSIARRRAPHASRVDRTVLRQPYPPGRDSHPLCIRTTVFTEVKTACPGRPRSRGRV
jgi:hypothetical protein